MYKFENVDLINGDAIASGCDMKKLPPDGTELLMDVKQEAEIDELNEKQPSSDLVYIKEELEDYKEFDSIDISK